MYEHTINIISIITTFFLDSRLSRFVDIMRLPRGPGVYTLAGKEARKKRISTNTASGSKQQQTIHFSSSTWYVL